MPDFGQYTEKEVFEKLKESCSYDGKTHKCVRCGKPTKVRLILGAAICNECLNKKWVSIPHFSLSSFSYFYFFEAERVCLWAYVPVPVIEF